jgi:hypothetical protein
MFAEILTSISLFAAYAETNEVSWVRFFGADHRAEPTIRSPLRASGRSSALPTPRGKSRL